jgi:hypothetical protein
MASPQHAPEELATAAALEAARQAWLEEVAAATVWLAGCLETADAAEEATTRDQERAKCIAEFERRQREALENYERVQELVGR